MKTIIFFLSVILLASCSDYSGNRVPVMAPQCHTELAYTPLHQSELGVVYTVQKGQNPEDIVRMHKTDPNRPCGMEAEYNSETFFNDNPWVAQPERVSYIKVDPCDSTKKKAGSYLTNPLLGGEVVYLRISAKVDTVPGFGDNVVFFEATKSSPIKYTTECFDVVNKPIQRPISAPCGNEWFISNSGDIVYIPTPTESTPSNHYYRDGGWNDFWASIPNMPGWLWLLLLIAIFLLLFGLWSWTQHKKTRELVTNSHVKTREESVNNHKSTRTHSTEEHATTRSASETEHKQTRTVFSTEVERLLAEIRKGETPKVIASKKGDDQGEK